MYCGHETAVTNSRHQKRSNRVWRRRRCKNPDCGALFSTEELADLEKSWVVQYPGGVLAPFLRDKLFVSIYNALRHRPTALPDSVGLTGTVIAHAQQEIKNGGLEAAVLARIVHTVLSRFDKPAAISYQAFHADLLA